MNWDSFIEENSLAELLPNEYLRFVVPVKEGLVEFLRRLPGSIQKEILETQLKLPSTATLSERLGLLARSCPVLQKLGQVLARDQRIAAQLRHELRKLESVAPTVPLETIHSILNKQLGSLEAKAIELIPPAIAEASVAVVIPFRDLNRPQQAQGVFKILKPGIEERLHLELDILSQVGSHLDNRLTELHLPQIDFQDTFEQVREKLLGELRLDEEQKHLARAAKFYARQREIQIPEVLPHCTSRITAMERIFGAKVTDDSSQTEGQRCDLANVIARAMLAQPILSLDDQALFHCDPHAGNLFLTHTGRLAILDWSLVGFLGERERIALTQVLLAAVTLRSDKIVHTLLGLDTRRQCDRAALTNAVENWLHKFRRGSLPGFSWLVGLIDDAAQTSRLSLSAEMLMFRKMLLTLSGVLSEVGTKHFNMDQVLLDEFMKCFLQEWPIRWLADPSSRAFSTRLSNLDLAVTVFDFPFTIGRYWRDMWNDAYASRKCA